MHTVWKGLKDLWFHYYLFLVIFIPLSLIKALWNQNDGHEKKGGGGLKQISTRSTSGEMPTPQESISSVGDGWPPQPPPPHLMTNSSHSSNIIVQNKKIARWVNNLQVRLGREGGNFEIYSSWHHTLCTLLLTSHLGQPVGLDGTLSP